MFNLFKSDLFKLVNAWPFTRIVESLRDHGFPLLAPADVVREGPGEPGDELLEGHGAAVVRVDLPPHPEHACLHFSEKFRRGMRQTLQGSFSAVSTPNFAKKYSLESSRRDLHNALLCTVL